MGVKRILLAAGGAAILTIGALGVSYAQTTTPTHTRVHPLAQVRRDELQVAANTLGLPNLKALRAELAGSTLTAVAEAHHVQPSTVASAIQADLTAKVQAAASAGTIKAKRVDKLDQRIPARVSKLMMHQFKAKTP
jgi:hypothetical protein